MHHHSVGSVAGYFLVGGGAGLLLYSLIGAARRRSESGRRLLARDPGDLRGKPFAGRNYYMMKWAPISASISIIMMLVGLIMLVASG